MLDEPMTTDESTPPAEDEDTIGWTVPNFFVEDDEPALRKQVGWAERHLGLADGFYAKFLRVPESSFRDWRLGRAELSSDRQGGLREFWRMMGHLISWMGMDEQRVNGLLEHQVPLVNEWGYRHPNAPPWSGTSLRSYLEERGTDVLPESNTGSKVFDLVINQPDDGKRPYADRSRIDHDRPREPDVLPHYLAIPPPSQAKRTQAGCQWRRRHHESQRGPVQSPRGQGRLLG